MQDLLLLLIAIALAAAGGECFLKAILGAASRFRVSKTVVATTLAAFATSAPELTVSTVAALSGRPEIGLGDALGSNVVNVAFIFGLSLLYGSILTERSVFGPDYRLALAAPLLTLAFAANGTIARWEAICLLAVFALWLGQTLQGARSAQSQDVPVDIPAATARRSLVLGVTGLLGLILAGRLFVTGATGMAAAIGMDTYVVGVLLVAIGTSLPELVTVVLSRLRGHDAIGVGTLIGSNLFNGLAIVGMAGTIHPVSAPFAEVASTLLAGILALLLLWPDAGGRIARKRGGLLLMLYALFVWITLNPP